jgi:CRAL/TRIO, N-terminal domain
VKVRFLRARKFNVANAFTMFSESEQWRKEFKVEELIKSFKFEENPQVSAYYPRYYHKTDRVTNSIIDFCTDKRMEGLSTSSKLAKLMLTRYSRSPHKNACYKTLLWKLRNLSVSGSYSSLF